MKYIKQFAIILAVTCVGEILKFLIPLPVPASIYGLVLLFAMLVFKVIKIEQVKEAGEYLVEIMPLMFIPAGVGLIASWEQIQGMLVPLCVITPVTTFIVMFATGKVTDIIIGKNKDKGEKGDE